MNNSSLTAAFWTMIFLNTLGSVDMPGKGPRKMPSPRAYIASVALYAILGIVADAGAERAASYAAWGAVLIGMVKGPFGNQMTNLFNAIAPPAAGSQPLAPIPPDTSGATP